MSSENITSKRYKNSNSHLVELVLAMFFLNLLAHAPSSTCGSGSDALEEEHNTLGCT